MDETPEQPQLYLITPPEVELSSFPTQLAGILDGVEIACVRLSLATREEDWIARVADACREIAHARDVPLVIDTHFLMVERLGLDGVHLGDGARSVRKVRKALGTDAVVGAWCAASQHDGISAGEAGADYVSFGPVSASLTGGGDVAEPDLFAWWTQMIEVPVVAEGGLTPAQVETLAPLTDFFAIGEEIWRSDDPLTALKELTAPLA